MRAFRPKHGPRRHRSNGKGGAAISVFVTILASIAVVRTAVANGATLLPGRTALVRAIVIGENNADVDVINLIRIEHVYAGDPGIIGRTFSARSAEQMPEGNGSVLVPRLRIGEVGIWLVEDGRGELFSKDWYNYMRWPARRVRSRPSAPDYDAIRHFSECVEAAARLDEPGKIIAALKQLATDESPYSSSWAISRLAVAAASEEHIASFMDRLVGNDDVPIQGQVELDKALIAVRGAPWRESKERLDMFRRWLGGQLGPRESSLVVTHLDLAAQHPTNDGFSQAELLKLTRLMVENDHFAVSERARARYVLMWAARRYESDQKVFETAVDLVDSDLPDEIRTKIAWVLVRDVDLNAPRRDVIRGVRKRVEGQSVVGALDDALARPNDLKKQF